MVHRESETGKHASPDQQHSAQPELKLQKTPSQGMSHLLSQGMAQELRTLPPLPAGAASRDLEAVLELFCGCRAICPAGFGPLGPFGPFGPSLAAEPVGCCPFCPPCGLLGPE